MRKVDLSKVQEAGSGNYKKLPAGGYVIRILKCEDVPDKNRLDFYFDIDEGEYKGFYGEKYKNDTRETKKWGGRFSKSYDSSNEKALPFFKQFVTAVQNSNKGFVWDEEHEQQFVKKVVGATFREEEYQGNNGKIQTSCKPDMFHSADKIRKGDFEVRELKKLDATKVSSQTKQDDFIDPFAQDNKATEVDPFSNTVADSTPADSDTAPWDDANPFA